MKDESLTSCRDVLSVPELAPNLHAKCAVWLGNEQEVAPSCEQILGRHGAQGIRCPSDEAVCPVYVTSVPNDSEGEGMAVQRGDADVHGVLQGIDMGGGGRRLE